MFSVTVFYDERVVIVAEQRPDASEEDSFQWMSRVLQVNMEPFIINHFALHNILLLSTMLFGFLYRPSTASIRWDSTVWLWSRPTPYLKHPSVASTSLTPSSSS